MNSSAGRFTTKAIAVIVVVAMLDAVGFPPVLMVLITGAVFVVWLISRRAQAREIERIFEFYVAADAILREEERRWYGFEIVEVIEEGESLIDIMPDPPPLNYYVLGALYQRLGNHDVTVEYLTQLNEDEKFEETHRRVPSPQLRRFVAALRRIEYQPSLAPQSLAAIRSLERSRQRNAAKMLYESRSVIEAVSPIASEGTRAPEVKAAKQENSYGLSAPLSSISAPPPISKVLHDVYQEEPRANN